MPYADCVIDWETLLPYWDAFEGRGLVGELLNRIEPHLETPIGVLGCGRGSLVLHLAATHGASQVEGYDASQRMLDAAAEKGTRHVYRTTPDRPIPATRPLGSLIVATGVLDPLKPEEITSLLAQVGASLAPNGQLFVSAFNRRGSAFSVAKAIGVDHPLGFRWASMLRHCLGSNAGRRHRADGFCSGLRATVDALARLRESSVDEAAAWLAPVLPRVRRLFEVGALVDLGLEAGFTRFESHGYKRGDVILLRAERPLEVDLR